MQMEFSVNLEKGRRLEFHYRSREGVGRLLDRARRAAAGICERLKNLLAESAMSVGLVALALLVVAIILAHAAHFAHQREAIEPGSESTQSEDLPFTADQFFGPAHPGGH